MLFDKLIDTVLTDRGVKPKLVAPDYLSSLTSATGGGDIIDPYGDPEAYAKTYERVIWVYRCIYVIANNIATLPIGLFKLDADGQPNSVTDRPEFDIFKRPNKWQTKFDFWMESVSRLMLQGELFWELDFGSDNRRRSPLAVYADWRSEEVTMHADSEQFITSYSRLLSDGSKYDLSSDQVFYMKFFNPRSQYRGMSPISSGRDILTLELNAMNSNKNFFSQGLKIGGILETPQKPTEPERMRLKESFEEIYKGTDKAHQVAVLWGGLKFTPLNSMNLRDVEFSELRTMNREDICSMFGVPLEVAGFGKKTYENWKEARKSFWQETLIPILYKIYSTLNKDFLPLLTNDSTIYAEPILDDVEALNEDLNARSERFFRGFSLGAISPNDIRTEIFGLDPIEDEAMDATYLPFNVAPVGAEITPPSSTPSDQGDEEDGDSEDDSDDGKEWAKIKKKILTRDDRTKIWKAAIRGLTPWENKMIRILKKFFRDQADAVAAAVRNQDRRAAKVHLEVEGSLFDLQAWIQTLDARVRPTISAIVERAMNEFTVEPADLTDPRVAAALGKRVVEFSTFVNNTTNEKIQAVLRDPANAELSLEELAAAITESVFDPALTANRANLIARTESYGAHNFGTQAGLTQGGWERKMWITSRDGRVRDSHQIDGQVVNIDEPFQLADGDMMDYPQDFNERCIHIGTTEERNI